MSAGGKWQALPPPTSSRDVGSRAHRDCSLASSHTGTKAARDSYRREAIAGASRSPLCADGSGTEGALFRTDSWTWAGSAPRGFQVTVSRAPNSAPISGAKKRTTARSLRSTAIATRSRSHPRRRLTRRAEDHALPSVGRSNSARIAEASPANHGGGTVIWLTASQHPQAAMSATCGRSADYQKRPVEPSPAVSVRLNRPRRAALSTLACSHDGGSSLRPAHPTAVTVTSAPQTAAALLRTDRHAWLDPAATVTMPPPRKAPAIAPIRHAGLPVGNA